MAGVWQAWYKYLLGFLIVLVSGTAGRFAGKIERLASFINLFCLLALFYCLGNWFRNYSVYLPFEIPRCTYGRHLLAITDRF